MIGGKLLLYVFLLNQNPLFKKEQRKELILEVLLFAKSLKSITEPSFFEDFSFCIFSN